MITPTVGRVVWFYRYLPSQGHKGPLAAMVAQVHGDRLVNLMVVNADGTTRPYTNIQLMQQEDGLERPTLDYCEWMPYQVGQAAKTEALEKKLAEK